MIERSNPFQITKSDDFSDKEIVEYWVEFKGAFELFCPSNPMPQYILGSKGSGKTHLMRYYSYNLQKIRYQQKNKFLFAGIVEDGYLGVYSRCSALNASRFEGKGIPQDTWNGIFEYYMEIWLAELMLTQLNEVLKDNAQYSENERIICTEILDKFDASFAPGHTIADVIESLIILRKEVDDYVNNSVITRNVNQIKIRVTRGTLIFGIPQIFLKYIDLKDKFQFLFLLDEFENYSPDQQKYINTLVRERQTPTSFRIGSRLFGIKSMEFLGGKETLVRGSEYQSVVLDELLRKDETKYKKFALELCWKRLKGVHSEQDSCAEDTLKGYFDSSEEKEVLDRIKKIPSQERMYFKNLRGKLIKGIQEQSIVDIQISDIDDIISKLFVPHDPFLEKVNIFLFYKKWSTEQNFLQSANDIKQKYLEYQNSLESPREPYWDSHYNNDLIAQLTSDADRRAYYCGLDTFISMSWGNPRCFLNILKEIDRWAQFYGEEAYTQGSKISCKVQQSGVQDASKWFYNDAPNGSGEEKVLSDCVARIATLLRTIRFSDKPSECSLSSFSLNFSIASAEAAKIIELAEKHSLIIKIDRGRKNKNSKEINALYQINRMLAPLWELPINRRGTLELSPKMVEAIFAKNPEIVFEKIVSEIEEKLNAPGFGKYKRREATINTKREAVAPMTLFDQNADKKGK